MNIRLLGLVPLAAVALAGQTATALADDYGVVVKRMTGQKYTVLADCSGELSYSSTLTDNSADGGSLYIYADEDVPADERAACNGDGKFEPIELEVFSNFGNFALRYVGPGRQFDAETIAAVAAKIQDELGVVDSISGYINADYSAFGYTALSEVPGSYDTLYVYLDQMDGRKAVEYLYACYQICEKVTLELQPLEFSALSGGSVYLYASGWRDYVEPVYDASADDETEGPVGDGKGSTGKSKE